MKNQQASNLKGRENTISVAVLETAKGLHKAGIISKDQMQEYNKLCDGLIEDANTGIKAMAKVSGDYKNE